MFDRDASLTRLAGFVCKHLLIDILPTLKGGDSSCEKRMPAGPFLAPLQGVLLTLLAKIPHGVDRSRLPVQLGNVLVFDPELVGKKHIVACFRLKTATDLDYTIMQVKSDFKSGFAELP